jgi:hypothetical protein
VITYLKYIILEQSRYMRPSARHEAVDVSKDGSGTSSNDT